MGKIATADISSGGLKIGRFLNSGYQPFAVSYQLKTGWQLEARG